MLMSVSLVATTKDITDKVAEKSQLGYSKNLHIRTLNFDGQVTTIGSYLMVTNSNIRMLGS